MLRLVVACNWLLMLMILTLADRSDDIDAGALGVIGLLKVGSRIAIMGTLAYLIAASWSDQRRAAVVRHLLPWAGFGAWAVASTLWSPLQSVSLGQSISLLMLLAIAFCTAMFARRMVDVSQLLMHLCLALLLLSTVLIAARYLVPDTMSLSRSAKGLFHPTNAAAAASLALVLVVGSHSIFYWNWSRWLLWPSLVVQGATLFLASNRASLVITPLVVVGVILLQASPIWRWLLLTVGSFACAAYVALDPGFLAINQAGTGMAAYMSRDQSARQMAELSGREEMWSAIWESYLRSPWLGHGYFVSSDAGELKVWYVWTNWTAHNFWLQVLVGTGAIGAALLASAIVSYGFRLLSAPSRGAGLRRLAVLGGAVLLWQTAWGLTNESFVGPLQVESIVFFSVLGLVTGRLVRVTPDPRFEKLARNTAHRRQVTSISLAVGL